MNHEFSLKQIDFSQMGPEELALYNKIFQVLLERMETYDSYEEKNQALMEKLPIGFNGNSLASAYHEIHSLHAQIQDYQRWLQQSQDDLEFMKKAYEDLQNSTCWKMTAPIRKLMGQRKSGGEKEAPVIKASPRVKEPVQSVEKVSLTENPLQKEYDIFVSVVIPTFNAGDEFPGLISSLMSQKGIGKIELVIVDSGSRDQTVETAKKAGAVVRQIPNKDFTHSYARNLGAETASGDYLLFMVQDAMPTDDYWLYRMATPMLKYSLAAVSCSETPRKDVDLKYCVDTMLHNGFVGVDKGDCMMELPETENYFTLRENAQLSDIACLFPKDIFMKYKFRGSYAEDLDIGMRLIQDGYRLALLSSVKVVHSHNRPASYGLRRAVVDIVRLDQMFDDLPKPAIGYNELVASIIDGYAKVIVLTSHIRDYQGEMTLEAFERSTLDFIKKLFKEPVVRSLKHISQDRYADSIIEDFLTEVEYIALASDYHKVDIDTIPYKTDVQHYLKHGIIQYLTNHDISLDKGVLEEIAQAVYKRFFWEIGTELAYYIIGAPFRDRLYDIAQELKKGI